ncbi:hypothetical protein G9A89_018490 [Geosiphon pyriformis]|nr:hypothetical protein G9A89_018490 [Geosiphon pyriformis]
MRIPQRTASSFRSTILTADNPCQYRYFLLKNVKTPYVDLRNLQAQKSYCGVQVRAYASFVRPSYYNPGGQNNLGKAEAHHSVNRRSDVVRPNKLNTFGNQRLAYGTGIAEKSGSRNEGSKEPNNFEKPDNHENQRKTKGKSLEQPNSLEISKFAAPNKSGKAYNPENQNGGLESLRQPNNGSNTSISDQSDLEKLKSPQRLKRNQKKNKSISKIHSGQSDNLASQDTSVSQNKFGGQNNSGNDNNSGRRNRDETPVLTKNIGIEQNFKRPIKNKIYRPPKLGVLPVYDEALKYINQDQEFQLRRLEKLDKRIDALKFARSPKIELIERFQKLRYEFETRSLINDPEVRWKFKNGMADMSIPAHCHMSLQEWRQGPQQKLMERLHLMFVIPDVFPSFDPTLELKIFFVAPVVPGVFQRPRNTINKPRINLNNYHQDTRLYTVIMVDPDMPDVKNKTYQFQWHWLLTNVPVSATQPLVQGGDEILSYIPPHPPEGTKYHRYTVAALEQYNNEKIYPQKVPRNMNVRQFVAENQLTLRGMSFFREEWDPDVAKIYRDILGKRQPKYGLSPYENPKLDETGKYPIRYLNL